VEKGCPLLTVDGVCEAVPPLQRIFF